MVDRRHVRAGSTQRPETRRRAAGVALALGVFLAGGAAHGKSLEDVVRQVVLSHPEISAIRYNRQAIDQELRQSRGLYLPSIDARGAVGHEITSRPNRAAGETGYGSMNRYEAGVSLRQLVFDGFGTRNEVRRQIGRAESAQFRVADTVQAVALRAVEAYLETQRSEQVVAIAIRNVETHEGILLRVQQRERGGGGPRSDVDQAEARLAAARSALASARGRYEDAVAAYRSVVGEMPEGLEAVSAPELELPPNLDEAVEIAVDRAPSIKAVAADARSAQAAIGVANANFMPRADIEVGANYLYNVNGIRGANKGFSALLVGRWNLYRGGIDISRKREAVARLFEARNQIERTRREVARETRVSWNALNAARERRVSVRAQIEANRKVQLAYSQQFDRGQRTLLDLLDIQNEIFNNETTLVTEEATITFGVYRTLATMGRILEVMKVDVPIEATKSPPQTFGSGLREHWGLTKRDFSR